ncbi:tetratricopeptide repeat protein [Vibrio hippocampi]|uniref:Sel1 repeat family protein n=1 Tax=Vibrio hippocampi TaxID=654686 RepID=A0ABN8DLJ9_9VIBR|nr:tetratricopeptide repeat protein [Vibrio hippocampi]CAH0530345.1 hypothetical protein VHP8226_03988 [Vibrio hippocampi]
MSTLAIAIAATSLSLMLFVIWMVSLTLRNKRIARERIEREARYRRTIEKARQQERQERQFKAETGHIPTILYLAKEAERTNVNEALYWYSKGAGLESINAMHGFIRVAQKKPDDVVVCDQAGYWKLWIDASEGNRQAKFEAGKACLNGRGTEQDVEKGLRTIEEAAKEGLMEAILFMGDWFVSTDNMNPSPIASTQWFKRAAVRDNEEGMIKLGLNYINGIGVEPNHERGCYWLERVAEHGNATAMYYVGDAWRNKKPNGNSIAYVWLYMSAYLGFDDARPLRDLVGNDLGVDLIVGLQSIAKPILKKMEYGEVAKHSLIKVFNRIYRRNIPLLGENDGDDERELAQSEQIQSATLLDDISAENNASDYATDNSNTQHDPMPAPKKPDYSMNFS